MNTKKEIVINFRLVTAIRPYSDGSTVITFENEHRVFVQDDFGKVRTDFYSAMSKD